MYEVVKEALNQEKIPFLEREEMSRHTSFKIGGPADIMVMPADIESLQHVLLLCRQNQIPYLILGRGSNVLVRDKGIEGVVIKVSSLQTIRVEGTKIIAGCGANLSAIANAAKTAGLSGLEFASGIPGSLGGAVYMNGGAYGGEMSQVVVACRYMLPDGSVQSIDAKEMQLSYRHSCFMENGGIVLEATMQLTPDRVEIIAAKMDDFNHRRREKQPLTMPSGGSFFKRPVGHFAGGLIEECGLKGFRVGDAAVSKKHAGFLVNEGHATCEEVLQLMEAVQKKVYEEKGVRLEPEVRIIGRK